MPISTELAQDICIVAKDGVGRLTAFHDRLAILTEQEQMDVKALHSDLAGVVAIMEGKHGTNVPPKMYPPVEEGISVSALRKEINGALGKITSDYQGYYRQISAKELKELDKGYAKGKDRNPLRRVATRLSIDSP